MDSKNKNKTREYGPVRIREKSLKSGGKSLYLDINCNGRRSYEFLKLYLREEVTREDKSANRETMRLARSIAAQRTVEVNSGRFDQRVRARSMRFFDYFQRMAASQRAKTTRESWEHCLAYMKKYEPDSKITFGQITRDWVEGFRRYLDTEARSWSIDPRKRIDEPEGLAPATKALYFQKLCAALNQAVKEDIIIKSPALAIKRFDNTESERCYLTVEEIRQLAATECDVPLVKSAFLFSCLSGMRWSDVIEMKWGDLERIGDAYRLTFRQVKTLGIEYLDLSRQATAFLDTLDVTGEYVFGRFMAAAVVNHYIKTWVARAGIDKRITFHCARHSFAVNMLTAGADIYTLSKLMGHRDLKSTQVYARIIDRKKQETVNLMPDIF